MNKSARIYVAGHRGLVGSAIVRELTKNGYSSIITIPSTELDLRRQSETEAFFEKNRPEYVFLAAAMVGGIMANNTYKADFIYNNLAIALNVINSSYRYKVKKLLNLGSSCIYPKHAPQPMKEEYLLTGTLEPTNEPYAIAKISAIKLCRYFNEQYGTNFLSVMPTNLYGPNDNFHIMKSHVLPAIIRKFHLGRLLMEGDLNGIRKDFERWKDIEIKSFEQIESFLQSHGIYRDKIVLWGSGKPYREFLYVDDLAGACVMLMEKYNATDLGEFVNIGSGKDLTIREAAKITSQIVGYKGEIEFDESKPDGTPRKLLDIRKIRSLGWEAEVELKEGIKKTYEWYSLAQT